MLDDKNFHVIFTLNDLNAAISFKVKGISLGSDVQHTLLYADDLAIVAETPEGRCWALHQGDPSFKRTI